MVRYHQNGVLGVGSFSVRSAITNRLLAAIPTDCAEDIEGTEKIPFAEILIWQQIIHVSLQCNVV